MIVAAATAALPRWSALPEPLRERYMCGYCMYLAIALHERFNAPIVATIQNDALGAYIAHAWVERDDEALDAHGVHDARSARDAFAGAGTNTIVFSNRAAFEAFFVGDVDAKELAEARSIVAQRASNAAPSAVGVAA